MVDVFLVLSTLWRLFDLADDCAELAGTPLRGSRSRLVNATLTRRPAGTTTSGVAARVDAVRPVRG